CRTRGRALRRARRASSRRAVPTSYPRRCCVAACVDRRNRPFRRVFGVRGRRYLTPPSTAPVTSSPNLVDLNPLKIDRGEAAVRKSRRGTAAPFGWIVVLAIIAAALYLFHKPLLGLVDRVRLPEVAVTTVSKSSPLAASAVSGTAANGYIVASKRAALSADTP